MSKIYGYKGFNIKEDGTIYCSPFGNYKEYKVGEVGVIESKILDDIYVIRFENNIQYVAEQNINRNLELVEEQKDDNSL